MNKVLAKFICNSVTEVQGEQKQVTLSAVTDGCEENKSFSRWTPAGNISLTISNETKAGDYFEIGKEYYITFSKEK